MPEAVLDRIHSGQRIRRCKAMKLKPEYLADRLRVIASNEQAWKALAKRLEIDEADFVQWALREAAKDLRAESTVSEVRDE